MKKIAARFLLLIEWICIGFLLTIALVIGIQMFCRTFAIGISWTEEIARLAFCMMSFIGAPLALAEGLHIVVDMVVDRLPRKLRMGAEILISIIIIVFSLFCIRSGFLNLATYKGVAAVSMDWLQMNWIYAGIMISFVILLIISVVRIINIVRGKSLTLLIHENEVIPEEKLELNI
ncbi:MAG: TRAP transporter small permease [Spirochaetia bacterium]|jgi:TRAP-type C4-dicarboxylate transport system permease small subunit|nr:TRAP transporter small permease [Spirochaetia bacterium]